MKKIYVEEGDILYINGKEKIKVKYFQMHHIIFRFLSGKHKGRRGAYPFYSAIFYSYGYVQDRNTWKTRKYICTKKKWHYFLALVFEYLRLKTNL